jgi:hypothetical protein
MGIGNAVVSAYSVAISIRSKMEINTYIDSSSRKEKFSLL